MLDAMFDRATGFIDGLQTLLFVDLLQPIFYALGLMGYAEDAYDALYWVIVGLLQVLIAYLLLRPLEALRPAEPWTDRRALRADVIYTWIARLGLLNIAFFFLLQPLFFHWQSLMAMHGLPQFDLDGWLPGISDRPVVSFAIYFVVLDFAGYWYHRWQHRFGIWWELHAVHHSQRQLSLWSDDRNHFLDEMLQAAFFAALALVIGVAPGQFLMLVAVGNFLQSVQHANARIPFGPVLGRLLVSPAFHRRHHAIGDGHEGVHRGCNFGVLLPWWDMLFGSASWDARVKPTGIADQLPAPAGSGRDYGGGIWAQQWRAFGRIGARLAGRASSAQGAAKGNEA